MESAPKRMTWVARKTRPPPDWSGAGRQTRPHGDLDLVHREEQEPRILGVLAARGFAETLSWRPVRFVLADPAGREIDLHPLRFADDGSAEQSSFTPGEPFRYPAACFVTGTVLGTTVRCLSAEQQWHFHQGYEPRERDLHDLALLVRSRYGLVVIDTPEDERVLTLLRLLANELDVALFLWSRTRGLRRDGLENAVYGTTDPAQAISHLSGSTVPALYYLESAAAVLEPHRAARDRPLARLGDEGDVLPAPEARSDPPAEVAVVARERRGVADAHSLEHPAPVRDEHVEVAQRRAADGDPRAHSSIAPPMRRRWRRKVSAGSVARAVR